MGWRWRRTLCIRRALELWRCANLLLRRRRLLCSLLGFSFSSGLLSLNLCCGAPLPVGYPTVFVVHGTADYEQAPRNAGFNGFVHGLRMQRHRHRVGLVSCGVIESAVEHDG